MKRFIILSMLIISIFSCDRKKTRVEPIDDPDWIKLEIPSGREAYAIAGDIDKTLLVTTYTKAYYSTDRGKTWQESKNFNGPVPGLLVINDTTFSMEATTVDPKNDLPASSLIQYFTTDFGKSWVSYFKYFKEYRDTIKPIGYVKLKENIAYSIKHYTTPISPGSSTGYVNPSEIIKSTSFGQQTLRFPFKHNLLNLHVDTQGRLYVAASGGTYQSENNTFYCCPENLSAIVYVSKRPLP